MNETVTKVTPTKLSWLPYKTDMPSRTKKEAQHLTIRIPKIVRMRHLHATNKRTTSARTTRVSGDIHALLVSLLVDMTRSEWSRFLLQYIRCWWWSSLVVVRWSRAPHHSGPELQEHGSGRVRTWWRNSCHIETPEVEISVLFLFNSTENWRWYLVTTFETGLAVVKHGDVASKYEFQISRYLGAARVLFVLSSSENECGVSLLDRCWR